LVKHTSGSEYRKLLEERRRARKSVALPSGAVFEIRKVGILVFSRIFRSKRSLLDEIKKAQNDESKLLKLLRSPEVGDLFCEAVTDPVIVPGEAGNDQELCYLDIEEMDLICLFNEIGVFNDLDKFVAGNLGFFRKKQAGFGGGDPGGEVSQAAQRDRGS